MEKPNITIITLTKNNLAELGLTLNSIFSQDFNFYTEILIVDGYKEEKDVQNLISNFEKTKLNINIKIRYINSFLRKIFGIYPSMNLALDNVSSEYLIFMNSGDMFFDEKSLGYLFKSIKQDNYDICFGQTYIEGKNNFYWINPSPLVNNINLWCRFFEPIHQSMLIKTSLAKKNKFDTNSPIGADAQWKRNLIHNNNYFYLSYPVSRFALGGISNKISLEILKLKLKEPSRRLFEKILEILKFILYKIGIFNPRIQKLKNLLIGILF